MKDKREERIRRKVEKMGCDFGLRGRELIGNEGSSTCVSCIVESAWHSR